MAESQKKYFGSYWNKNREEINRRRRERYKGDPSYRQKIRDSQREKYQDGRTPQRGLVTLAGDNVGEKTRKTGRPTEITMTVRGKSVKVFTISGMATAMNCSVAWVRALERRGVIPAPTIKSPHGARLYTVHQIKALVDAVKECSKSEDESWESASGWENSVLPIKIKERWSKLGKDGVPW